MKKHLGEAKEGWNRKGSRSGSRKGSKAGAGVNFWNKEYKDDNYLALSTTPSEDLEKFTRWLERESGKKYLNPIVSVLDLGCGNGRNLIYLSETYGMRGIGYDISPEAIVQAKRLSGKLPLSYEARSIAGPLDIPDTSQTLVLDMMVSHFLNKEQRKILLQEISRVMKVGGWLFLKTFLSEGDLHVRRLINQNPTEEEGSYIHPDIGVAEHTFTTDEISEDIMSIENEKGMPVFSIHKITKSHRHTSQTGSKRRSMSLYIQKIA